MKSTDAETVFTFRRQMTVNEVASVLGCGYHHVLNLIHAGKLPAINISTGKGLAAYRIDPAVFAEFMERSKVGERVELVTVRRRRRKLKTVPQYV